MPTNARPDALRLAFVSIVSSIQDPTHCARLLESATAAMRTADKETLAALGVSDPVATRLDAIRLTAAMCASCAACPRGRMDKLEPVTTRPQA